MTRTQRACLSALAVACFSILLQPTVAAAAGTMQRTIMTTSGTDRDGDGRDDHVSVQDGAGETPAYLMRTPPGAYSPALPGSAWIGPIANAHSSAPAASWRFKTSFVLPPNHTSVSMTVNLHADNHAAVYLNGVLIGQQQQSHVVANFQFPAEAVNATSGFRAGSNEVWVDLANSGGPAGLNFQIGVTYSVVLSGLLTPDPKAQIVPDQYIVVFKDTVTDVQARATRLAAASGATVLSVFEDAAKGFGATIAPGGVQQILLDPGVEWIEHDTVAHLSQVVQTQSNPGNWGLDRIDQRSGLDGTYTYAQTGRGVRVYVIDTGIDIHHRDFGGRATAEYDTRRNRYGLDCDGHGTQVAGIIGSATYGVAKQARLVSVGSLSCGAIPSTFGILEAVNWITKHGVRPAVVNMSLGSLWSPILNKVVKKSIDAQFTYVVSAGNKDRFACEESPASVPEAITVGATDTSADQRRSDSNWGYCVDIFAPGSRIVTTTMGGGLAYFSGTSAAAPFVSGAAALYLEMYPSATPAQVHREVLNQATQGTVRDSKWVTAALLYTRGFTPPPPMLHISGASSSAGGPPVQLTAVATPAVPYFYSWYEDRCVRNATGATCWTISTGVSTMTTYSVRADYDWRYSTVRLEARESPSGPVVLRASKFVDGPAL